MKLEIDMQNVSVSNTELLKLLEYALRLDYNHSSILNGVVCHYYFNEQNERQYNKTSIPEDIYKAYTILRNYLTEGD